MLLLTRILVLVLACHGSLAVVVSKQSQKNNDASSETAIDSKTADTRAGYPPYQFHDNVEITHGVEIPQHVPMNDDGGEQGLHLPGAAAHIAQLHREMASAAVAAATAGTHHIPQHHHVPEKQQVEYVTYQYEGHHEHHEQPRHPEHNLQQHDAGYAHGHGGGYGLPAPVPVTVPLGHHHHHHLPEPGLLGHHAPLQDAPQHLSHDHLGHPPPHHHHLGHHNHGHSHLKRVLVPLAGIALLGAAAALATNPVLLQLGVVSGKKRRRRSTEKIPIEHRNSEEALDEMLQTTTMSPEYEEETVANKVEEKGASAFANLTHLDEQENEIGVRMREIMVLEKFLKQQAKESGRRSGSLGSADGALSSLLTCSGLLNAQSSVCLQRMACEAYSDESELPALELRVVKIILHELLVHEGIPEAVKLRLRAAVTAGIAGHRCDAIYRCPANAWARCTDPEPQVAGIRNQH
ncbi:hypothetical protein B566_EDAN003622 [Ephemera danica]|nr:hypothetical protein B566_EDAN003622 [Ephemera danica]